MLVSLDADKGINNGEPFLHAMWIGKVAPKPGETVTHVGAGTGYYTALLAQLVLPDAQSPPSNWNPVSPTARERISKPMAM